MGFRDRLQHGWNAFINNKDPTSYINYGTGNYYRPDRLRLTTGNEKTIVSSIYNRMALDVSSIEILHVRLDKDKRFLEEIDSCLNNCLTLEANVDQTGKAFIQDVVMTMLDEGCIAIVPIDTTLDPEKGSYDIKSMRVGTILEWYPRHVKVRVYNDITGKKEDIILSKNEVGIIENPFYAVMNSPNSTMQRLKRKLSLLDITDERTASGKLDLIIQLPYTVKSTAKEVQAEKRRNQIENQLANSNKYGIAYVDSTEKITQLNRPIENNLMKQIEYLTSTLYSQLSINQSILDGTADDKTMLNYYSRTIKPIVTAIVDEIKRKFLTKTARSQKQSILFFKDPFELVTAADLATIADTLTRNEISTSNEMRQKMGWKPSKDPKADELRNKNLSEPTSGNRVNLVNQETEEIKEENQNGL